MIRRYTTFFSKLHCIGFKIALAKDCISLKCFGGKYLCVFWSQTSVQIHAFHQITLSNILEKVDILGV